MDSKVNGHGRSDTDLTVVDSGSRFRDATTASPTSSSFEGGIPATEEEEIDPPIIPPKHEHRTLVLCFDGTGDQFDQDNSNIVAFFSLLKRDDRSKQLVYYQAGIGTYTTPQIATPMASKVSKILDEAIAWNLHSHVMGGYEFLMQNYIAGDKICIFGFSRGAYTARSLAGMIHKVGILPSCNHQQIPFAYKMYTRDDDLGWGQSNAFKKAFSVHAEIEFVGVWDTVNSVGLIPKKLPFSTSNTIVHNFRHAVALDERRALFKANLWNQPTEKEQTYSVTDQEIMKQREAKHAAKHEKKPPSKAHLQRDRERQNSRDPGTPTSVEEVWFAGCHCDIGGGSVGNDVPNTLANIPLRWMIRECFKTNTGIMFESAGLLDIGLDPKALYPKVLPRPALEIPQALRIESIPRAVKPSKTDHKLSSANSADANSSASVKVRLTEEEWELKDALSPIYDQLELKWWFWWVQEFFPFKRKYRKSDNSWTAYFGWPLGWNLGTGRHIPKKMRPILKVHRSVQIRMEAVHEDESKYIPKADLNPECKITWVD